ncbi:OmpA family protein [Spirosoma foliorum]|uniref:OmpA family protein n=1 Tax=Spirosoma foliorum TaxID=2710596 RepID=A0A7G5GZ21_9BACT|nr:OmpA family protein [Spirosoma foliorum]QMW04113.1 OmpA family protein [Spirosoma foliorum]
MNWTKYIVVFGGLCLSNVAPSISWAQPQHQVAPTGRTALVNGTILDGQTKQPIVGATVLAKSQEGIVRTQQVTNTAGVYQLLLDPKQSYIVTIKAEGYADVDEQQVFSDPNVTTLHKTIPTLLYRSGIKPPSAKTAPSPVHTAATTVVSPPITRPATTPPVSEQPAASNTSVVQTSRIAPPKTLDAKVIYTPPPIVAAAGTTTQLQALQFVQSKAELLPDAQPALEQLLGFMRDHPTAVIELAGHTDNQGDFDENLKLSKQRVELVKDYLVKNGVTANRVATRGYGPTRPIASNNSENTRRLNRRVEMTVLKE